MQGYTGGFDSFRTLLGLRRAPWDTEDKMVGDSVGENCFGCCQRDSPPLGTMSGLSWALLRDVAAWVWPVTRGEPEREEEEQERELPIPLLWLQRLADDWMDWLLSEELLREDCRDWLLSDDCREELLSDRRKEVELRELGREWLLRQVWMLGLLSEDWSKGLLKDA